MTCLKESNLERTNPKTDRGRELLVAGGNAANAVIRRAKAGKLLDEDAAELARALETLRSATNWLEGSELFDVAHVALDTAGRARRHFFPADCAFEYEDGHYTQTCPVSLAHNRLGMSIGGVIRESQCSICGEDPEDCSHVSGRTYGGEVCVRIIHKFDLDHVALVATPDFPDARIMSAPVDLSDIKSVLGDVFVPGMTVTCDRCLTDCQGVSRPFQQMKGL